MDKMQNMNNYLLECNLVSINTDRYMPAFILMHDIIYGPSESKYFILNIFEQNDFRLCLSRLLL